MEKYYTLNICGLQRELPLCKINDNLYIAAFIMLGDVELTQVCAANLLKLAPAYDYIITAECKGIPLIHEMARQSGNNHYILARKGHKLYMKNTVYSYVNSITTKEQQVLCLDQKDINTMRGKRILIVDDCISTGESLTALEKLVEVAEGTISGRMTVLAEGDAIMRKDIISLGHLPLFDANGNQLC